MIDYGQGAAGGYGGNDFSAQPRLVNGIKFKDPYGRNVEYVYHSLPLSNNLKQLRPNYVIGLVTQTSAMLAPEKIFV